jgi:hypothetical protein
MSIEEFCTTYEVPNGALDKLTSNGYSRAHMLRFVTIAELGQMAFLLGETVALRDAVDSWAVTV